ncbi:MAG: sulfite exporter TauE/SafE family protein [Oceanospirillaceae bacterium]|nr:sulfite exporter TauE/SafE family protein [Oceanospirillaceae bacterium]MCP5350450.1 sulfite exporter TauE/SafE family protein [Oceanospirillaceae bacterium]
MAVLLGYLLVGALAGVLAGLFGIGGGLVIVPVLIFVFSQQGVSPEVLTHMAIATSLATICFTSLSSIRTHQQNNAVDWPVAAGLSAGIVLGAVLGALTAEQLSGPALQVIIGVFALVIAAQMGFGLKPSPSRQLPGKTGQVTAGAGIGFASAIFGIGGGSLTVPFLSWCNMPMQRAVATAAACGLPIAVFGALSNVWIGYGNGLLPEHSLGYVYLPALLGIALTSVPCARIGARLAHQWSAAKLKKAFAILLLAVGLKFLLSNLF